MNLLIGFLPPMLTLALTLARHLWYKLRLFRQFAQDGTILTHRGLSFDVNLPLSQDDCKVRRLDRRGGRWSVLGGRHRSWLSGAWTSGGETIPPIAGAFSAMLTSVAYTSPNPGRRSVWTSSSQLRSFTWCRLFSTPQWLRNTRSSSLGPHRRELRLLSKYQCSRLTSPVPMSTLSFSTIAACLAPGNPNSSRIYSASASSVQMRRFSITPAFFRQSPPPALPVPPGQTRRPLPPVPRAGSP